MNNNLGVLYQKIEACNLCRLRSTCIRPIVGDGVNFADIMLVGEAPGASEDESGKPFVGRSGKLLSQMLSQIGVDRDKNLYITNTVKCKPPENRNPKSDELQACREYLKNQISLHDPKVIILVGNFACKYFLGKNVAITKIHGHFFDYNGKKLFCTFHPAAILRNPKLKDVAAEDIKILKKYLNDNRII